MGLRSTQVLIIAGAVIVVILVLWYIRAIIRMLVTGALRIMAGLLLAAILVAALAIVLGQWRPDIQTMLERPRVVFRAWLGDLKAQAVQVVLKELDAVFRTWLRRNLPLLILTPIPRSSPLPTSTPSPANSLSTH